MKRKARMFCTTKGTRGTKGTKDTKFRFVDFVVQFGCACMIPVYSGQGKRIQNLNASAKISP